MRRYKTNTEEVLYKKLYQRVLAILVILFVIFAGLKFFAPKIGSLFGLFSINRKEPEHVDSIAPTAPEFSKFPEATNTLSTTIDGVSEPGATVTLFVNGPKAGTTTADSEGAFTFINVKLHKGKNLIFVKAADSNNNESPKSETITVISDDDKPEITISSPKDGETVKNLNKRVTVTGKTNEEATVTINDKVAISRPDLTFEILLGVDEGSVEVKVTATDKAGNKAEKIIHVTYQKES